MYAIVRTGGKQYRVERGQRLLVERLKAKEGAEVSLEPLLYRSEEPVLDRTGLKQVQVTAKVIEHVRGEKLRVFKFKPKRGYKRRTGHRQALTRIEVSEISAQKKAATTAKAPASETAKAAPAKPKAPSRAKPKAPSRAKPKAAEQAGGKQAPKAKPKQKAPAPGKKEDSDGP